MTASAMPTSTAGTSDTFTCESSHLLGERELSPAGYCNFVTAPGGLGDPTKPLLPQSRVDAEAGFQLPRCAPGARERALTNQARARRLSGLLHAPAEPDAGTVQPEQDRPTAAPGAPPLGLISQEKGVGALRLVPAARGAEVKRSRRGPSH